jgi:hypothetical protein
MHEAGCLGRVLVNFATHECPLFGASQTQLRPHPMSWKCHVQTHALQHPTATDLLDHLVGAGEEPRPSCAAHIRENWLMAAWRQDYRTDASYTERAPDRLPLPPAARGGLGVRSVGTIRLRVLLRICLSRRNMCAGRPLKSAGSVIHL